MKQISHRYLLVLAIISATLVSFTTAAADNDGQWYLTPMGTFMDDSPKRGVDDGFAGGQLGIGRGFGEAMSWELSYFAYDLDDQYSQDDEQHRGINFDLLREFAPASRFSPYIVGGIGYTSVNSDISRDIEDITNSLGLGIMAKLNDKGGAFRAEVRQKAVLGDYSDRDSLFSAGVRVPFGERAPPPPLDSDGDGVNDARDRCPGTPMGTPVDANGCKLDGDSDGDGVKDSKDRCPNTKPGVKVDSTGCAFADSDGDGVSDNMDKCPNTPRGAKVDARGCEFDSDGDGVVDSQDRCAGTAAGARVDVYGCEFKDKIRLPGVNFELNSAKIRTESYSILNDAAQTLNNHSDLTVEASGHTDSTGADSYNLDLSKRRAASVVKYLVSRGVAASRIKSQGYGETQPIADNKTKEGRAMNRRVVLNVLNQD